jgi:hypothetical protein
LFADCRTLESVLLDSAQRTLCDQPWMRGFCSLRAVQHCVMEFGLIANKAYSVMVGMRLTASLTQCESRLGKGTFGSIIFFVKTKLSF